MPHPKPCEKGHGRRLRRRPAAARRAVNRQAARESRLAPCARAPAAETATMSTPPNTAIRSPTPPALRLVGDLNEAVSHERLQIQLRGAPRSDETSATEPSAERSAGAAVRISSRSRRTATALSLVGACVAL